MNYYEHHLGDYAEATAHLSFVEDAAYSRMIRKYYATENPLPVEPKAVQRLVGARTKEEKEAVDTILKEFFDLRDDGWHNARCDAEIERFKDKQEKAKRSANARWNNRESHSEGNANASPNAMRTHSEGNAHQTPDTRHQVNLSTATAVEVRSVADGPDPTPAEFTKSKLPDCPHQRVIDLYHAELPTCPQVREWNQTRQKYLQSRWREKASVLKWQHEADGLEWFKRFFVWVSESEFLTGKADGRNGQSPFVADLEWLIRPSNFAKVVEGKYH